MRRHAVLAIVVCGACNPAAPVATGVASATGVTSAAAASSSAPPTIASPPGNASSVASAPAQKESRDMEAKLPGVVGKPLSSAVAELGLDERAFRYVDEPPAKLKVIRVAAGSGELEIHLRYDSALLFSENRDWPLARIGRAEVLGVVWRGAAGRRVLGVIHERLSSP